MAASIPSELHLAAQMALVKMELDFVQRLVGLGLPALPFMLPQQQQTGPQVKAEGDSEHAKKEQQTDPSGQNGAARRGAEAQRGPNRCSVCQKPSLYRYYGVRACESCKQFFRRVVAKQSFFNCAKNHLCQSNCRGCRLNKCLVAGMDPRLITLPKSGNLEAFIERLEAHREQLL